MEAPEECGAAPDDGDMRRFKKGVEGGAAKARERRKNMRNRNGERRRACLS
jgi:hypothetical protein